MAKGFASVAYPVRIMWMDVLKNCRSDPKDHFSDQSFILFLDFSSKSKNALQM